MAVPKRTKSLDAVTTGTGTAVDVGTLNSVTAYIICAGTISTGVLVLEEADTGTYSGTWSQIGGSISLTPLTGGAVQAVHLARGSYAFIRARVTTNVTGASGKVTVVIRGQQ